jgi:hypothetical protein
MTDEIKPGTFLIQESALLPDTLRFGRAECTKGWFSVRNLDGREMDRQVREAGWTFFFLAGEVTASVFGWDADQATQRALQRVLADQGSEKFNCLEIAFVARKRFLGLYYVRVSAHWRHIQESMLLSRRNRNAAWDLAQVLPVLEPSLVSPHP